MKVTDPKKRSDSTGGTLTTSNVEKTGLRRFLSGEPNPSGSRRATLRRDTANVQKINRGPASIELMTKATTALEKYSDRIALASSVGDTGRYVLKSSGIPLVMIYDYIVEGLSNDEIASMVDGLSSEEVAMVHDFIDSLL